MPTVGCVFPINFLKSKHSSTDMPVGQPDTNNRSLRHSSQGLQIMSSCSLKVTTQKTSEWEERETLQVHRGRKVRIRFPQPLLTCVVAQLPEAQLPTKGRCEHSCLSGVQASHVHPQQCFGSISGSLQPRAHAMGDTSHFICSPGFHVSFLFQLHLLSLSTPNGVGFF